MTGVQTCALPISAKDATYRKVYTAWKAFREEQYRWFAVAELGYAQFAFPGV